MVWMETDAWESFEAEIATLVLIQDVSLPEAIGDACRQHPKRDANALLLSVISFVTHFDHDAIFLEDEAPKASIDWYRMIAVLAAEVVLLPSETRTCGDLQLLWMTTGNQVFR